MHARVSEERSPEERPAVILVHELIVSSRYMVPTLRQLVPRHRVYAPDLLGFDKSASTPRPERVRALLRFSRLDGDGWSKECGACRQLLWLPDHSRPRHTQPQARRANRAARPDDDHQGRSVLRQIARFLLNGTREPLYLNPIMLLDALDASLLRG